MITRRNADQQKSPDPLPVKEVHPRWRTWLLIGSVASSVAATVVGVYGTFFKDDAIDKITPITRISERANNGLDRIDRMTEALKGFRNGAVDSLCPDTVPECVVQPETSGPEHTRVVKIGPFLVKQTDNPNVQGDGSVFFRWGD